MFFLTVGLIKLFIAMLLSYSHLQLPAELHMREYSHTNVCYQYIYVL